MTLLEAFIRELGIQEIVGDTHNDRIIKYHSATTLKAKTDEVPWCSSLINFLADECGLKKSGSAAARSWLNVGTELDPDEVPNVNPNRNIIVIFKRGKSPTSGHVAIYVQKTLNGILVAGGNQSNMNNFAIYPVKDVLGYRELI